MQFIVGQVKDNWKGAHLKGSSSLHMVDKFSISLQVERKTVETTDPAWPSIIISATKVADPFQLGEGGHIEAHGGQAAWARLVEAGRRPSQKTVEADLVDSEQYDDHWHRLAHGSQPLVLMSPPSKWLLTSVCQT